MYYDAYLEHHGIKGQKWGVRRFETESGHLTAAGKARYDDYEYAKNETKKAKEGIKKASIDYNKTLDKKDLEKVKNAQGMYRLRKKQESDSKAKVEMNARSEKGKKIGKHEQKLIDKYKEKGMSQEEAEVAAYKRAKLDKALAIGATVTIAAAAAYGAKKYHDYVTDEVLEVGKTKMKRVTQDGSTNLNDTFYSATGKDANKYVGLYGNQIKQQGGKDLYQKTIDLKEDIKIASDKNAKKSMSDVLRKASPESKKEFFDSLDDKLNVPVDSPQLLLTKQGRMIRKGAADIKNGKYDTKAAYDVFNYNMTNGTQGDIYKAFKKDLKDRGYSGIKDRNDQSYSGYNAKTARIIFDNSKVTVSDVRKLSNQEIGKKYTEEINKIALKQYGKMAVAGLAAVGVSNAASKASESKRDSKVIADYKKEHPNSKLTNDEILENHYGGK